MRSVLVFVLFAGAFARGTAGADTVYKPVGDAAPVRAVQERPYVLQPPDRGLNAGQAFVGNTISAGRRAGRALDNGGLESLVNLGYAPGERITLDGFAGFANDGALGATYGATLRVVAAAQQWQHPLNVVFSGGALREHDGTPVAQLGYAVSRDFGKLNVATTSVFEKAFAPRRDAADAVLTAGASYALARGWRAGLEAAGEDLEALVSRAESEGGARLVAGPTLVFELLEQHLNVGLNAAGGVAYVPRPTLGDPATAQTAFMTRARVTYTF